nr:hypothetical protein I308_02004 [Cryptococcus tetragattii IND107]
MVPFCIAFDSESGKNVVLIVLTYNLGTTLFFSSTSTLCDQSGCKHQRLAC